MRGGGEVSVSGATARRVIVFDSLSAVAEAEAETEAEGGYDMRRQSTEAGEVGVSGRHGGGGGANSADGRVAALLRCCGALPSCAVVALAHADASAPAANAAGGWLAAAARRADVTLACVGLGTGSAEDVHGHVHVNHRTGRMMPDPRGLTDAAAAAADGVRGLSLGAGGGAGPGWGGAMEEEEFDEHEAPPRAVSARFQLTELGPRVTRIHRPAGSGTS